MNRELKVNDPVMWKRNEYKFVEYSPDAPENQRAIIQQRGESFVREVPIEEVDLIQEFDYE